MKSFILKGILTLTRMLWILCFLFSLGCFPQALTAQSTEVFGTITNAEGKPLGFANVYLKGTTQGTTSNEKGRYQLDVPEGKHTLVFQYTGYERKEKVVQADRSRIKIDISLKKQSYDLETVEVTDRDPAYRIMQNAIDRKPEFRQEVTSYKCKAYSKGKIRLEEMPEKLMGQTLDTSRKGLVYLSESVSHLYYQFPDELKEEMISSKVSGRKMGISINFAANDPITFYENRIDPQGMTHRPLVSPVSNNAFNFYDFEWQGTFENDGRTVHRIQLTPKRDNAPAFTGTVNILDEAWRIHSLNLYVSEANGVRNFDTLRIKQSYLPANDSIWRLYNQNFDFTMSVMGIRANGQFLNHFSKYELDPDLSKNFFDNEILKVTEEATNRDSNYWNSVRPVKLLPEEEKDYREKDSIAEVRNAPAYKDSVDREHNKPSVGDIFLTGYNYRKRTRNFEIDFKPLLNIFQFNAVEGLVTKLESDLTIDPDDGEEWRFEVFGRYGFSNSHWNGGLKVAHQNWQLEGGSDVRQFDPAEPLPPSWNTFEALFDKRDRLKLFEKAFARGRYEREIFNGVQPALALEWSKRRALTNSTDYSFAGDQDRSYEDNIPVNPDVYPPNFFETHEALVADLDVRIRFDQDYLMMQGEKINLPSDYPELHLNYRKGLKGVLGSDVDYDYFEANVAGDHRIGLLGEFEYRIGAGRFWRKNEVPFIDYRHFNGNEIALGKDFTEGFQVLDYYRESTNDGFAKAHGAHHFNGFLWSKLPWLKKLQWQVVVNGNWLLKKDQSGYWEWGAGLENLVKLAGSRMGRIQFYQGYYGGRFFNQGIRFGIGLGMF